MTSAYKLHVAKWRDGCGAEICSRASRRVMARGTLPADVLFVGEAPGPSENVLGVPFVGPAGKLLDQIVDASIGRYNRTPSDAPLLSWAFTNLVACIPLDDGGEKWAEPDDESIHCCADRLRELVGMARPRLIVTVGKLAGDYLTPGYRHSINLGWDCPRVHVTHPAAILRANVASRGLEVQRCIVTISNALEDL